jgi:hypothetical protein
VQRDMDLVRKILLYIEGKEDDHPIIDAPFDGYDEITLLEHYHLIFEAGLVRGETICSTTTPERVIKVIPFGLTWAGHDFTNSIKNDSIWNKAKDTVSSKLSGLPFDVLKAVLIGLCKEAVKDAVKG